MKFPRRVRACLGIQKIVAFERFLTPFPNTLLEMRLDESMRAACDELVPPGSAVANFHNSAAWMKMKIS